MSHSCKTKPMLLLVDVQQDYLARPGLTPAAGPLLQRMAQLLADCRARGIPVVHVHTRINRDGSNRMAHLRRDGIWWCVEGTPGAESPPEAAPAAGEGVFYKDVFNAFTNSSLHRHIGAVGADVLIIAGLHLHACVRETALAAYQSGYRVWIADDAVGSYDVLHAELSRDYLGSRGMEFLSGAEIAARIGAGEKVAATTVAADAAWIGDRWLTGGSRPWERRNPARWNERLESVAQASDGQIEQAAVAAAQAQGLWRMCVPDERGEYLAAFAQALRARGEALIQAMVTEVGKPIGDAGREVDRAVKLTQVAVADFCIPPRWQECAKDVHARRQPVGVVAAITPFNNPLAISIGKLIPALALGNAAVWKPALPALKTTQLVVEALAEAGLPDGLVTVVLGDGQVAQRLARHSLVDRVSVTASVAAGRQLALACAATLKPIQAELGGNNAVVVMGDADVGRIAEEIARSAFSFAGQRCTAARRILVERGRHRELTEALVAATRALHVGDPGLAATDVGPLISRAQQQAVATAVAAAVNGGARVLCGGGVPSGLEEGCWYEPTLVADSTPDSALFREETFGPVALIHPFDDIDAAVALVNAVPHGLVATLYSDDESAQRQFFAEAEVGLVKLNCAPAGVHADAPFGGWKNSGLGPPEHGHWDEEFYTRVQALYGWSVHAPG